MATTTNYSWETPDDTDLVKDGAAAIRTLGSSIDTTTKALNPSTTLGDIEYRSATANTNTRLGVGTTGQVLTVAGGVPSWATPAAASSFVGCRLTKSASQSINNTTVTNVSFDQETFDTDAFHDNVTNNTRITIPSGKGGKYLVTVQTMFTGFTATNVFSQLKKNGTEIMTSYTANSNTAAPTQGMSQIFSLVATDYIEVAVYQNSGTAQNLLSEAYTPGATIFSVTYLGA
jgi:hypothetical protein